MHSALLVLKGQVYEALDNRNLATDCYKEAIASDINCFEALNALLQHRLLTCDEGLLLLLSYDVCSETYRLFSLKLKN